MGYNNSFDEQVAALKSKLASVTEKLGDLNQSGTVPGHSLSVSTEHSLDKGTTFKGAENSALTSSYNDTTLEPAADNNASDSDYEETFTPAFACLSQNVYHSTYEDNSTDLFDSGSDSLFDSSSGSMSDDFGTDISDSFSDDSFNSSDGFDNFDCGFSDSDF